MSDESIPSSGLESSLRGIQKLGEHEARNLAIEVGRQAARAGWLLPHLVELWLAARLSKTGGHAELIAISIEAFQDQCRQLQGTMPMTSETTTLSSPLERLSALHRISQSATASLDLDSMLTTVVRVVRETLGCDACSIFLFDPSSDTLVLRASIGLNPGAVGRVTLPLGAGITGQAALKREVVAVIDAVSHPSYVDYPLLGDQPYCSHVSAPLALRSPDRLIGVLNLMTIERRAFVDEEVAFVETAAGEIAMAIENALLYSETDAELHSRISQLSTLRQMSRLVASTLDLPQVLELVSRQAAELTRGVAVEIYKDNAEDGSPPELLSHYGAGDAVLTERVRREVRSMVNDVVGALGTVERSIEVQPGERLEVMALPMLTGRRAVGAICVYSEQHLGDDPEFHGMLHAFSDSAAIAIENAELYDEARRGWQRTSALLQEMHHRVRNNLQTVAALLSMQARHASNAEATVPLYEAVGRIRSIAAIHDVLSSGSISETTVGVIAKHVTDEASMTILPPDTDITFDIDADDVWVSSREATVLALLINEFVSNAFVHGFSDRTQGRIEIVARTDDEVAVVEVNDNGSGVPEGFDPGATSGLGLQIARTLTESDLNGSLMISRRPEGGTAVRVTFRSRRIPDETAGEPTMEQLSVEHT